MKTIKTKPTDNHPKELSGAARAPKELIRSVAEQTKETAQNQFEQGENPQSYATDRVSESAQDIAASAGQGVRRGLKEAKNRIEKLSSRGADNSSSFSSAEKRAYNQGKERVVKNTKTARQTTQNVRNANNAARSAKNTANATKATAKGTVKTAQKSVKVTNTTVKTSAKAIKTSAQAAKTAAKTAQATAKAAARAAQAAKVAAKAAVTAIKVTVKAIIAGVKAAIAAIKALIAAIAAGGWVAIVIVIVVAVIALILGSAFGIFASNDPQNSLPISTVVMQINDEYSQKIDNDVERASRGYDEINVSYDGGSDGFGYVSNWPDVLGVFAVRVTLDEQIPDDVLVMTTEKAERLKATFYDMNSYSVTKKVTYRTETGVDDEGNEYQYTVSIANISVQISCLDYDDMMSSLTEQQVAMLTEIMQPEYYSLMSTLLTPWGGSLWGDSAIVCSFNIENKATSSAKRTAQRNMLINNSVSVAGLQETTNSRAGEVLPLANRYFTATLSGGYGICIGYDFNGVVRGNVRLPGNGEARRLQWVSRIMPNGKTLTYFNTHIHWDTPDRPAQIKEVARIIKSMNSDYVVLTGDFNVASYSEYKPLTDIGLNYVNRGQSIYTIEGKRVSVYKIDQIFYSSATVSVEQIWGADAIGKGISDHNPIFAKLTFKGAGVDPSDGDDTITNPNLPNDPSIGAALVKAAKKYVGVSYSVLDCSAFTRRVYSDCGIKTINGLTAAGQAKKCVDMGKFFTDKSQLQPGDLIFYSRPSSKGADYCTDTARCGAGKCKRYMRIHHVAMYVDSKTRIDSTGGKSSVHFRAVWGMGVFPPATGKWVICGYGRPRT